VKTPKNIPSKLENHPEVKRREITGMREKVSHGALLLGGISFPPN
jgi:uncharacterized protein with HEPN domain